MQVYTILQRISYLIYKPLSTILLCALRNQSISCRIKLANNPLLIIIQVKINICSAAVIFVEIDSIYLKKKVLSKKIQIVQHISVFQAFSM